MASRLFISYSHKDEVFRSVFQEHIAGLEAHGYIDGWSDRKILAGQCWDEEIHSSLENSAYILMLVSPSFISSPYCTGVEMKKALELHDQGRATVIPIPVRPCDWMEYEIAKYQAPEFAAVISEANDEDAAWLRVVLALKKRIVADREASSQSVQPADTASPRLRKDFKNWLYDTEVRLVHRRVSEVSLVDVFVPPDLRPAESNLDKMAKKVSSLDRDVVSRDSFIFGDEQSGKTTLAKQLFLQLLGEGLLPVYAPGSEVKSTDVSKLFRRLYKRQYHGDAPNLDSVGSSAVLIIDDFDDLRVSRTDLNDRFLKTARREFSRIVLFASEPFKYVAPEIPGLLDLPMYTILPFGNARRSDLARRWVEIGRSARIDESSILQEIDELKVHINSLVRRNIVPARPIYLLTILQTFESHKPIDFELTSYGHCYQQMIYLAFEKANVHPKEYDSYFNLLTVFAGALFRNDSNPLSSERLKAFYSSYASSYIGIAPSTIVENLRRFGILTTVDGGVAFRYRYIYFFYVAKYLAETLVGDTDSKGRIQALVAEMHKEEYANIIIFITHHTKDPWVLDEIQVAMMELFADTSEASLISSDLAFMQEFLDELPKLIVEQREAADERRRDDDQRDREEQNDELLAEELEDIDPSTLLARINRAFRGIEIIGQIMRNRHGSLERQTLIALLSEAYGVGLRFLQYFLNVSDIAKEEIVRSVRNLLKDHPDINDEALRDQSVKLYLMMTYGMIYGLIRKIAFSVGARETKEIHDALLKRHGTPAVKLINETVNLQFTKQIDHKRLASLTKDFKDNKVCQRVLCEIVVQHIYMHQINYKEKQKVSDLLGIPLQRQLIIEKLGDR